MSVPRTGLPVLMPGDCRLQPVKTRNRMNINKAPRTHDVLNRKEDNDNNSAGRRRRRHPQAL